MQSPDHCSILVHVLYTCSFSVPEGHSLRNPLYLCKKEQNKVIYYVGKDVDHNLPSVQLIGGNCKKIILFEAIIVTLSVASQPYQILFLTVDLIAKR